MRKLITILMLFVACSAFSQTAKVNRFVHVETDTNTVITRLKACGIIYPEYDTVANYVFTTNGSGRIIYTRLDSALYATQTDLLQANDTITGVAPIVVTGTTTNTSVISITKASGSDSGYLSAADWNTFNGKEPAVSTSTASKFYSWDKTWRDIAISYVTALQDSLNLRMWTNTGEYIVNRNITMSATPVYTANWSAGWDGWTASGVIATPPYTVGGRDSTGAIAGSSYGKSSYIKKSGVKGSGTYGKITFDVYTIFVNGYALIWNYDSTTLYKSQALTRKAWTTVTYEGYCDGGFLITYSQPFSGSIYISRIKVYDSDGGDVKMTGKIFADNISEAAAEDTIIGWKKSTGEMIAIPMPASDTSLWGISGENIYNKNSGTVTIRNLANDASPDSVVTVVDGVLKKAVYPTPETGGSVTSVGLALPSTFTVTVTPIATSGDLTAEWADTVANKVFAGPPSGGATKPTFRSLVMADLPPPAGSASAADSFVYYNRSTDVYETRAIPAAGSETDPVWLSDSSLYFTKTDIMARLDTLAGSVYDSLARHTDTLQAHNTRINAKLDKSDTANQVRAYKFNTRGGLLIGQANNQYRELAPGSNGQVLKVRGDTLYYGTDETGAGGTLTWPDTLAQLATDYDLSLKQDKADTSTVDATRYWTAQNYIPASTFDANGDIIMGLGDNTYTRLAKSTTAGDVLVSQSSGGNLSWYTPRWMTYPGAGVPISTGTAWGTSITGTANYSLRYISGAWRAWPDSVGTTVDNGTINGQLCYWNGSKWTYVTNADGFFNKTARLLKAKNLGFTTALKVSSTTGSSSWTVATADTVGQVMNLTAIGTFHNNSTVTLAGLTNDGSPDSALTVANGIVYRSKWPVESDPVFATDSAKIMHWSDSLAKIATKYDLDTLSFLRAESDPVWLSDSSLYFTKTDIMARLDTLAWSVYDSIARHTDTLKSHNTRLIAKLERSDTSNQVRTWKYNTRGGLLIGQANNQYRELAPGTNGQILKIRGDTLYWGTDESGAGGTLTWGDTLSYLATDYDIDTLSFLRSQYWTLTGSDLYRNSKVSVNSSAAPDSALMVTGGIKATNIRATSTIRAGDSITGPKIKITPEGGYAIRMIAGDTIDAGDVVSTGAADGQVIRTIDTPDGSSLVGVAYNAADSSETVWVIVSGLALVNFHSSVTATRGEIATVVIPSDVRIVSQAYASYENVVGTIVDTADDGGMPTWVVVQIQSRNSY